MIETAWSAKANLRPPNNRMQPTRQTGGRLMRGVRRHRVMHSHTGLFRSPGRVATVATLLTLPFAAPALSQSQPPSLVGTWRVVRFCDRDSTGTTSDPLGPSPRGYFIYTPTGQLAIQVFRTPPTGPTTGGSVQLGSLAELRPYYLAYFGTYTITSDTTVIHHVEGGMLPEYVGTDQFRTYHIRGDTLSIGAPPFPCRVLIRVR